MQGRRTIPRQLHVIRCNGSGEISRRRQPDRLRNRSFVRRVAFRRGVERGHDVATIAKRNERIHIADRLERIDHLSERGSERLAV